MSIEKNLEELIKEKSDLNDAVSATKLIAERIQRYAQQGFQQSQSSESFDEKIQVLVQTIQVMANEAIEFHNKKEKQHEVLDIKIELLKKIIEETQPEELEEENTEEEPQEIEFDFSDDKKKE